MLEKLLLGGKNYFKNQMDLSGSRSALLYILGAHKALHVSQRTRPPAARSVSL